MKQRRIKQLVTILMLVAAVFLNVACGTNPAGGGDDPSEQLCYFSDVTECGAEGQDCYADGTCDEGLTCDVHMCLEGPCASACVQMMKPDADSQVKSKLSVNFFGSNIEKEPKLLMTDRFLKIDSTKKKIQKTIQVEPCLFKKEFTVNEGAYDKITDFKEIYNKIIGSTKTHVFVMDSNMNIQWSKEFTVEDPSISMFSINYVTMTSDGNPIIVSQIYNTEADRPGLYVAKLTKDGDILWQYTYAAFGEKLSPWGMVKDNKGMVNIFGELFVLGSDKHDAFLLQINSDNGQINLSKRYGESNGHNSIEDVKLLSDGNYLLTGTSSPKAFLIKIDSDGEIIWEKTYSNNNPKETRASLRSIVTTSDGFLVCGSLWQWTPTKGLLIKVSNDGELQWAKVFKDEDSSNFHNCVSIFKAVDDGYIVHHLTENRHDGIEERTTDQLLSKINENGDILWTKKYAGVRCDWDKYPTFNVDPTPNGYVIARTIDACEGPSYMYTVNSKGETCDGHEVSLAYTATSENIIVEAVNCNNPEENCVDGSLSVGVGKGMAAVISDSATITDVCGSCEN